jgi:hypothetical protein
LSTILLVHPGMMGAAIAQELIAGGHKVSWVPGGRSKETVERAAALALEEWNGVDRHDVVLSICPPAAAQRVAAEFGRAGSVYVDANAISPSRASAIAAEVHGGGGVYVDAAIIGAPPRVGAAPARLYLSGPSAADVARQLASRGGLELIVLGPPFAASALKMTYAAWTKVSSALLLAARAAADRLEIADILLSEWRYSQPELLARYEEAVAEAGQKGWRWTDEMRQIASTFRDCGLPAEFGIGAAKVFGWFVEPASPSGLDISGIIGESQSPVNPEGSAQP